MNHYELYIENLKCSGCANTVTKMLNSIEGITNSNIVVEEGKVEFDMNDQLELDHIKSALAKLGYPEMGTSTTLQKA